MGLQRDLGEALNNAVLWEIAASARGHEGIHDEDTKILQYSNRLID